VGPIEVTTEPRRISSWYTSETMRWPPGRSTRANSVITGSSEGRCARARAQTTMSTEVTGSGSWVKSPDSKRASGTRRRANANMSGELSTPMTWCPPSETLGESSGATGSIQGHTGGQPVDDAIDERLIHVEQPLRLVIARRPLLITVDRCPAGGGDSRVRTEHGVVEKLSHLAEPAPGKRLVKVPGPPPQQRQAFQPKEVGERVLVGTHRCRLEGKSAPRPKVIASGDDYLGGPRPQTPHFPVARGSSLFSLTSRSTHPAKPLPAASPYADRKVRRRTTDAPERDRLVTQQSRLTASPKASVNVQAAQPAEGSRKRYRQRRGQAVSGGVRSGSSAS